ncbi:Na/Pi symporter [Aquibacillus sediminis]|uniref:Na/Pi symporter n=1 Tax=Aquibacillus sediminis TaxID=2574734 RepID=UPI0011081FAF|nr:Na/Pi symporter [Aquibacillus sediminis]
MADLFTLTAVFLTLFFLGMSILRAGLYQLSYQKMERFLATFTKNIYLGILTGTVTTAILQSSSLVMILTIGLVSVGALSFKQSLGVLLGANIGTTITGEMMTISDYVPEVTFIIIGSMLLLTKHRLLFGIGAILAGLGSIFVALDGFESLANLISPMPIVNDAIQHAEQQPSIGAIVGTIVSGVIQSSSATIGITMSFLYEGLINLAPAIAIMLGANIGTCITAYIAAIGLKNEAKLVAMAHIWFNIIGVVAFLPFLDLLTEIAKQLSIHPREQLAHISVLFNVASLLLFLPFIHRFENFITRIHGKKKFTS